MATVFLLMLFSCFSATVLQSARIPSRTPLSFSTAAFGLTTHTGPAPRYERSYWSCTISIVSTTFSGMQPLVNGTTRGQGGAMHISFSHLSIDRANFQNCSSSFGGALYLVSTVLSCTSSLFERCGAMYLGGAIASTQAKSAADTLCYSVLLKGTRFRYCLSGGTSGAISINFANDVVLDDCSCQDCHAVAAAGAACFFTSNVLVFRTIFCNNTCGGRGKFGWTTQYSITILSFYPYITTTKWHGIGFDVDGTRLQRDKRHSNTSIRGGGAIFFASVDPGAPLTIDMKAAGGEDCQMATEHCLFVNNSILTDYGEAKLSTNDRGFDVLLTGNVHFQSVSDRYITAKKSSVQEALSRNMTNSVHISIYKSRWCPDDRFFDEPFQVTWLSGLTEARVQSIYAAFEAIDLSPPDVTFQKPETVSVDPTEIDDVSVAEVFLASPTPDRSAPGPLRTLTSFYSIYKIATQNALTFPGLASEAPCQPPPFHIYDLIRTSYLPGEKYDQWYRQCVVHVIGSGFLRMGHAHSDPNALGGALYVRESQLLVLTSEFAGCFAKFGGAFASVDSSHVVRDSTFRACRAFYEGGAVLVSRDADVTVADGWEGESISQFTSCVFEACIAHEVAGGLAVSGFADVSIDRCNFTGCHAGASAGAVNALDSNLLVFRTHFVRNRCGDRGAAVYAGLDPCVKYRECANGSQRIHSGGGAIRFVCTGAQSEPVHLFMGVSPKYHMGTEDSCFVGNVASERASNDVYIAGSIRYQSCGDRFVSWRNVSIGVGSETDGIVSVWRSVFFDDANPFGDGHICDISEYEAARASYSLTFLEVSVAYTAPVYTGSGSGDPGGDASAADDTPWATRVPPATRVSDVAATFYTPHVTLPVTNYSIRIHTPTRGFLGPCTSALVGSSDIAPSQWLTASLICAQSGEWSNSRSFASADINALGHLKPSEGFSTSGGFGSFGSTRGESRSRSRSKSPSPTASQSRSASAVPIALSSDQTLIETMFTTVSRVSWSRSASATVTVVEGPGSFVVGSMTSYVAQTNQSRSVTVVDLWTYSWTWFTIASATYIDIPLYETVTTRGLVVVAVSTPIPGTSRMSDSLLIGIATGGAIILVLAISAALYVVRSSRRRVSVTPSSESQVDDLATVQDSNRETVMRNGEDTSSDAGVSPQNWTARFSTLMSLSDDEPSASEEHEMYV